MERTIFKFKGRAAQKIYNRFVYQEASVEELAYENAVSPLAIQRTLVDHAVPRIAWQLSPWYPLAYLAFSFLSSTAYWLFHHLSPENKPVIMLMLIPTFIVGVLSLGATFDHLANRRSARSKMVTQLFDRKDEEGVRRSLKSFEMGKFGSISAWKP